MNQFLHPDAYTIKPLLSVKSECSGKERSVRMVPCEIEGVIHLSRLLWFLCLTAGALQLSKRKLHQLCLRAPLVFGERLLPGCCRVSRVPPRAGPGSSRALPASFPTAPLVWLHLHSFPRCHFGSPASNFQPSVGFLLVLKPRA